MATTATFTKPRHEGRLPMELGVQLSGHRELPGTEETFTENVSARGARVMSSRRWNKNDKAVFATLSGSFKAVARVAYCHSIPAQGFAIGLEFIGAPRGQWVFEGA
jgi:hypothetical protein